MIDRLYLGNICKLVVLISFIINMLKADTFIPSHNSELNYRQLEFSWPQIPNSDNYQITIDDINSNFTIIFNSGNNVLIYNGYELNWGESYSWEVCGLEQNNLLECHEQKVFN